MTKLKQILILLFIIETGFGCFSKKKSNSFTPTTNVDETTTEAPPTYELLSNQNKLRKEVKVNSRYLLHVIKVSRCLHSQSRTVCSSRERLFSARSESASPNIGDELFLLLFQVVGVDEKARAHYSVLLHVIDIENLRYLTKK